MKQIFQKEVEILHHTQVKPGHFKMGLAFPELAQIAQPGQFVMVKVPGQQSPLLRRPFSVHNRLINGDQVTGFELLYKVVGEGTTAMSEMAAEEVIDILGPLGNGFSNTEDMKDVFIVAGGIGVASLYYLVLDLAEKGVAKTTVFLGGCSANDILCKEEMEALGAEVRITTEDCSLGEEGFVTLLVEKALESEGKPDMIYACGPQAMLKKVGDIAATFNVPCEVSLETVMACGFGVCLGCAVEKTGGGEGYLHACTDGPVFDSRHVKIEN
jgi:dihydroorotate dehydrogenase electron transfer subunit